MTTQVKRISKYDLDTPSLLIDLNIMETNIKYMSEFFKTTSAKLRPHVKTHKSPIIAHKQIEAGAIGVTCQTVGEAEIFAEAGIKGILISNQIANSEKIRRFVNLSKWSDVIVAVDSDENAQDISTAAESIGASVNVVIEISQGRCGVEPDEAPPLARKIVDLKGLTFRGLFCHEGVVIKKYEDNVIQTKPRLKKIVDAKHLIENEGIPVEIVSAGHLSSYKIAGNYPEITDVQAGSYVFMDWPYCEVEGLEQFRCALSILTTIISKPKTASRKASIITDTGIKATTPEHTGEYSNLVFPKVKDIPEARVVHLSEEHGWIDVNLSEIELKIGDKIELLPSHCCTTANLHERYYGIRDDNVECIWPIAAKGRW